MHRHRPEHWLADVGAADIAIGNPGQTDGLEYQVRIQLPEGAGLRVRALTQVRAALRQRLCIEAEAQRPVVAPGHD